MIKKGAFFMFVLSTSLTIGLIIFFIFKALFDILIVSAIAGVATVLFIVIMEGLIMVNTIDRMRYRQQRDLILQSLEKRRRRWLWF